MRLLVDAGPLGYLSIAAHGHADALSFVLNIGDREILVDPGTYAYHTDPGWRRYFRSTLAHNTVGIDEQDQSLQAGNFMWTDHARARCIEFEAGNAMQRFVGEHYGYERLEDPVVHRREILFDSAPATRSKSPTCCAVKASTRHAAPGTSPKTARSSATAPACASAQRLHAGAHGAARGTGARGDPSRRHAGAGRMDFAQLRPQAAYDHGLMALADHR